MAASTVRVPCPGVRGERDAFESFDELEGAAAPRLLPPVPRAADAIVGRSAPVLRLLEQVRMVGASDAHVLICGESGTGKELVARMIHEESGRTARPFVPVSCAAFPENLLEAELFGHERGAFTGAVKRREGRFQAVHQGTLFLDEVAEIPLAGQAKLLRVLEEGTFEPLGTNRSVAVDVRVVSATHRDLRERIEKGLFREDLFYRLKVLELRIPPLRERREDIPLLVEHFVGRFAQPGAHPAVAARVFAAFAQYAFPGNVRELEHAIHHACVLARGATIDLAHLPPEIAGAAGAAAGAGGADGAERPFRPLAAAVSEFEREYLVRALKATGGRKANAAALLGISRKNLWEKIRRYEIGVADLARG